MHNRQDLECSITHSAFRHPIEITDENGAKHNYELSAFVEYLERGYKTNPLTRAPLVSYRYNEELKRYIDDLEASDEELDRQAKYESSTENTANLAESDFVNGHMKKLKQLFPHPPSWQQSIGLSGMTALLITFALYAGLQNNEERHPTMDAKVFALGLFAIDFFMRCLTNHKIGIFTLFCAAREGFARTRGGQLAEIVENFIAAREEEAEDFIFRRNF